MRGADSVPFEIAVVNVDSGIVWAGADGSVPVLVFSHVVAVPAAPAVRLHFQEVQLSCSWSGGNESFLRITSLEDGGMQILDSLALERWGNTSAYFNGGELLVELFAFSGTGANRVVIDQIAVGTEDDSDDPIFSICGTTDDRAPSADPRAGRPRFIRGALCGTVQARGTAFLFNNQSNGLLTAGHICSLINFNCAFTPIVEFNVPLSDPDGTTNVAQPQDCTVS